MGVLGACGVWRPASACEFYTGTLKITHPWTRATAPSESSAVLCMRIDEVTEPDRLIGVTTPFSDGAEMGQGEPGRPLDFAIARGSVIEMSEDGPHVRLTKLRHALQTGRDYPIALHFEHSGVVHARLSVDFPYTPVRFQ